jgi:hypothetical protein
VISKNTGAENEGDNAGDLKEFSRGGCHRGTVLVNIGNLDKSPFKTNQPCCGNEAYGVRINQESGIVRIEGRKNIS